MPQTAKIAYVATNDVTDLPPLLLSLQEQGFHFNGPPEMTAWFQGQSLPFTPQAMDEALTALSAQADSEEGACWVFILPPLGKAQPVFLAQREALIAYLLTMRQTHTLLVTQQSQYRMLQPQVLADDAQWAFLSRQLYQDIAPNSLMPLQKTQLQGDTERPLYSTNPAWAQALEVLSPPDGLDLSPTQLKNVLTGTPLMVQLARTENIHPAQAILLQHGHPVQVACSEEDIGSAVERVLFHDSTLAPGGTLVVSHALNLATLKHVVQAGVQVVVSTQWEEASLAFAQSHLIPVAFHLEQLQIAHSELSPMGPNTALFHSQAIDARQVTWQTPAKPEAQHLVDLEIGVVVAESLPQCAAVLVHQQQTQVLVSGMALPFEAVEYALSKIPGETKDTVCVLTGDIFSEHLFTALVQVRVAGVLLLNSAPFPPPLVASLKNLPFFAGTYSETGISQKLQHVGVRHG